MIHTRHPAGVLLSASPFALDALLRRTISRFLEQQTNGAHAITDKLRTVLILGSAPDAPDAAGWRKQDFASIVAINNAFAIRPDWDFLIHPEDFPKDRLPATKAAGQIIISAADYVPVQNAFGGFVYAGGTMAFTAGYWALGALKPDVMAFFGCDMIYNRAETHFYGKGAADPLRNDVTLQSLEAKSARLMLIAAGQGCLTVNLSRQRESQLMFPRLGNEDAASLTIGRYQQLLSPLEDMADDATAESAMRRESELNYRAENGRYWETPEKFDADELRKLDEMWLQAAMPGEMRLRRSSR